MAAKVSKSVNSSFYVVGIGASAGGLDAINQFFENVPDKSGFAFIIIQHLSPDYKSLMVELLTKHTHMKVVEAEDQMLIKKNCVYLLPSKKTLTVKHGKLQLHEKEKVALPINTIDIFFESIAQEYGANAVGVILSGTGTDGTKGVQAISNKGGVVIIQDPATATFNGMPNSAIGSGVANMVLPPQSMASELIDYITEPDSARSVRLNTHNDELVLREIISLIRKVTGQDFNHYKKPTLIRRLSKRMSELSIPGAEDYLQYMNENVSEIKFIAHDFLINVTHFFRDKEAFDIIKEDVIPAIIKSKDPGDVVKVWSVACSSGEEAYSLAILFHEYLAKSNIKEISVKIFATDIDRDSLEIASKGVYSRTILDNVPGQIVAKYFDVEGENYRVNPEIRKMVVFSHHDVVKDPPFGRLDLISCRNMMIYINSDTQKEILKKLHFALNLKGYLFVGPSEHIDIIKTSLEEVDKKWKIYKCVSKTRLYEQAPYFRAMEKSSLVSGLGEKVKNPLHHLGDLFKETLLEDADYAGVFIDLNLEIKQAVGNYKNYIQFPDTNFNFNLTKLVHPDLAVALSASIRKAVNENIPVVSKNIKLHLDAKTRLVSIHIKPYLHHGSYAQQFLFIVFKDEVSRDVQQQVLMKNKITAEEINRVNEVEKELKETRENLQAVIEEMEATNEELQSANEELVSTNEELQSTNEELQSLNEELHTVSTEHQMKIKELMELNDDMNNYFRNSDIGQILVDRNLIIRKFSPSVTRMVNLIPSDIHRSLLDITTRFKGVDFIGDIGRVIHTGASVEKEIIMDESFYLLRINPYERHDKKIDGVVVNFIDVTRIKRLDSIMEAVFKTVPSAILAAKALRNEKKEITDFEFIAVNPACEKSLGFGKSEIVGEKLRNVFRRNYSELITIYRDVVETGKPHAYDFYNEHHGKWTNMMIVKFLDGIVSVATDITEQKKAADLVEKNYEELRKSLKLKKKRI
ncbi:MAG: CheR family methyltransferase [Bacteroidia bacterium]